MLSGTIGCVEELDGTPTDLSRRSVRGSPQDDVDQVPACHERSFLGFVLCLAFHILAKILRAAHGQRPGTQIENDAALLAVDLQLQFALVGVSAAAECSECAALELDGHRVDEIDGKTMVVHQRNHLTGAQTCHKEEQPGQVRKLKMTLPAA
jgi:hypothetical protein